MVKQDEKKGHSIQLLLRLVVQDENGSIISDTGNKPSRSFVIQFLEFIYAAFRGTTTNATDVSGAETGIYRTAPAAHKLWRQQCQINAGANVSLYGQVVGTGDTAATNTDNKLETQLTQGVGAGNISHGAQIVDAVAIVGVNVDMVCKRSFTNNTGSTITIKEVGLYKRTEVDSTYHMLIRDVLAASVDVPDMCSLTVYHTLRTTV